MLTSVLPAAINPLIMKPRAINPEKTRAVYQTSCCLSSSSGNVSVVFSTSLALARSGWRSSVMSKQGKNGYQDRAFKSHQKSARCQLIHNTKFAVRTSPKLTILRYHYNGLPHIHSGLLDHTPSFVRCYPQLVSL